ncbi:oligosaccharide flippase family protein, partial [bacterium]|nr:oligosaccharide flippase family protein [bacterium]
MEKKFSDMVQLSTRGSLVLMIGQMASTLISAIGAIIIARFLGSTHYGIISIAQIPINVSMLLLNNGISNAIIHFLAESRHENKLENLRPIVVTGFLINMVIGFMATITVYQLAGYLSNTVFKITELEQLIKILSVSLLAQSMVNTSISVFAGFERMELRSLLNILLSILRTITGPALIFFGYGVIGAALGI